MFHGRHTEVMQRTLERREHEDSAARLSTEVPRLETLRIEISDGGGSMFGGVDHVRHVVVARAAALFNVTCGDHNCKDGGHDLTHEIMRALRATQVRFEGQHECNGSVGADGATRCTRTMKYVASATYRE